MCAARAGRPRRRAESAPNPRSLLYSEECERAVLGAILLEPQLLGGIDLRPDDFYEQRHQLIFAAMRHVHEQGAVADVRTIQARLESLGRFDAAGPAYLAQLDIDLPDVTRVDAYAQIVRERSCRRQLIEAGREIVKECSEGETDTADIVERYAAKLEEIRGASVSRCAAIDVVDFLARDLPPRRWLAEGLIQDRDILMLHAMRGCGKSHFCFGLAFSLACGVDFLRYKIREPIPVLLCDGEQQSEDIQARLRAIQAGLDRQSPGAPFRLLARDQVRDLPSLATPQGQAAVERLLSQLAPPGVSRVLVIDSLSTLAPLPKEVSENDEAGWRPIQEWLLRLRSRGVSTLFVHHDNRVGAPRGTSARETLPSQIVHLKRPDGYNASEGARFVVLLEKARGVYGAAAKPYEARLQTGPDGRQIWTMSDLAAGKDEAIREAMAAGITGQREIARLTGIPYTTVNRRMKAWAEGGIG